MRECVVTARVPKRRAASSGILRTWGTAVLRPCEPESGVSRLGQM